MRIEDWLRESQQKLERSGIATARLDALVLLEYVTGVDRAKLLAEPKQEIGTNEQLKLQNLLNRRAGHEPLAYIRGRTEFYGRDFVISPFVLEPRPESETMIDLLKKVYGGIAKGKQMKVADVGTGCGAIGITARLELENAHVDLIDIDADALKIAQKNVDKFTLPIRLIQSDLLKDAETNYDILLCNLPYVPDNYKLNRSAMQEPSLAIYGGPDGLDVYRRLFSQLKEHLKQPLYILCESLLPQQKQLSSIARAHGYGLHESEDFIQVFRLAS